MLSPTLTLPALVSWFYTMPTLVRGLPLDERFATGIPSKKAIDPRLGQGRDQSSPRPLWLRDTASSSSDNDRALIISLSVAVPVGILLITGAILLYGQHRRRRFRCFKRGVTPIDDDEIATWRVSRDEKTALTGRIAGKGHEEEDTGYEPEETGHGGEDKAIAAKHGRQTSTSSFAAKHGRQTSTSSFKKPPSLIVYTNIPPPQQSPYQHQPRPSYGNTPRRSADGGFGSLICKTSVDKDLPQTPVQARAPNARAGLTDEAIPGDDPFLPSPRRQPSRLYKHPPSHHHHTSSSILSSPRSSTSVHQHYHYQTHRRTRSSRSSTRSLANALRGSSSCGVLVGSGAMAGVPEWTRCSASEYQLTPRESHDQPRLGEVCGLNMEQHQHQHQRQDQYGSYRQPASPPPVYSPTSPSSPSSIRLVSEPSSPPISPFGEPFTPRGVIPRRFPGGGEMMLIGQAIG